MRHSVIPAVTLVLLIGFCSQAVGATNTEASGLITQLTTGSGGAAIENLVSMGDASVGALGNVLADVEGKQYSLQTKVACLDVLVKIASPNAAQTMEAGTQDANPVVRRLTVESLNKLFSKGAVTKENFGRVLRKQLLDEDGQVRDTSAVILADTERTEAVRPLLALLRSEFAKPPAKRGEYSNTRMKDFWAEESTIKICLDRIDRMGASVIPAVLESAKSAGRDEQYALAYLLFRLGHKPVDSILFVEGLKQSSSDLVKVRLACSIGDAGIADQRAIEALTQAKSSGFKVRPHKHDKGEPEWIYPLRMAAEASLTKLGAK